MTIAVQIRNEDTARIVEVNQHDFNRDGSYGSGNITDTVRLQPGEARTFYVHLLRELRISEQKP